MTTEQKKEYERGLRKALRTLARKRYNEADGMLAELDAAYPDNADIAAIRAGIAEADKKRRAEIDRGHWDGIFRIPAQALLIIGLIALFSGVMGFVHATPEFQRASWNGVVGSQDRNGHITRYAMRDWLFYSGLGSVAGVASLGFAAYARSTWED